MAGSSGSRGSVARGSRKVLSRGLATVLVATVALFAASWLFASSSLSRGVLLTMLPFASALAIAALGQTLVVMQGGIDLSIAGGSVALRRDPDALPERRELEALARDRHRVSRGNRRRLC